MITKVKTNAFDWASAIYKAALKPGLEYARFMTSANGPTAGHQIKCYSAAGPYTMH